MKTSYFTKVENKYVFNLSLLFWHLFIGVTTLAIIISIVVLLWSLAPSFKKKVEKQSYPEKTEYPAPVKVSLGELKLNEINQIKMPPPLIIPDSTPTIQRTIESYVGIQEYEVSLNTLKTLIPQTSWEGSGYWTYPFGERYWTYYKQEKYRRWNISEANVTDRLETAYRYSNAKSYPEKKQIIDVFISVVKPLPKDSRFKALKYLIDGVADNILQNVNTCKSVASVAVKIPNDNVEWIQLLTFFGKNNPNDGTLFIDYISSIIDKFDSSIRFEIINGLIDSFYRHFSQNIIKLKESTDLFIPMLPQIKPDQQFEAFTQYYSLYAQKNFERNVAIDRIENEYNAKIDSIDSLYNTELFNAEMEYQNKKAKKTELRLKSLFGIGGGVVIIVLIATLLVFLSIQRSVRKIEEKISPNDQA